MKMKKVIELKTIYKENFLKPEHFENKIKRLRTFCISESNPSQSGQKYILNIHPDSRSATLILETSNSAPNFEEEKNKENFDKKISNNE